MTDPQFALQCAIADIQSQIGQTVTNVQHELTRPFMMVRPALSKDGDHWCFLFGENLQEGVSGFGKTPAEAATAFDKAWWNETIKLHIRSERKPSTFGDPSNPLLAQILDAFHNAQDEVKEHLFHNSIYLFDALTRARHAMTKTNPRADATQDVHRKFMGPLASWARELDGQPVSNSDLAELVKVCVALAHPQQGGDGVLAEVAAERRHQIEVKGFTPEHDDSHDKCELIRAAATYAMAGAMQTEFLRENFLGEWDSGTFSKVRHQWPNGWDWSWFKPTDPRRDIIKALALGVAEIERMDRAAASPKPGEYVADEHGTPITGLSWCAAQPHEKNTSHCPACGVGPLEACRGRVPQDDGAKLWAPQLFFPKTNGSSSAQSNAGNVASNTATTRTIARSTTASAPNAWMTPSPPLPPSIDGRAGRGPGDVRDRRTAHPHARRDRRGRTRPGAHVHLARALHHPEGEARRDRSRRVDGGAGVPRPRRAAGRADRRPVVRARPQAGLRARRDADSSPHDRRSEVMAKIQHIDTLTAPPIVGQRYLVPTVTYPWFGKVDAWPVMGPKHTDAEHIGFDAEHYHVDIRLLSNAQVLRIEKASYGRFIENAAAGAPLATRETDEHPEPILKRLACRRGDNGYPLYAAREQYWYPKLAGAYSKRRCGRNAEGQLICPHKGFVLSSLVPDHNGRVVCPLHGLVIDTNEGAVVEHNGMPEVRT